MARGKRFDGIIISHVGNVLGRIPEKENKLTYVNAALTAGWHVVVDVQFHSGGFYLPHEHGFDRVPPAFLSKQRVWCQAADAETIDALCNINAHCFSKCGGMTLTSAQFVWTPPPHDLSPRAIAAFPEHAAPDWLANFEPAGLCSDVPVQYI